MTVVLGEVAVPSGVLVLAMAGWIDTWPDLGRPLSERASQAAAGGGGHIRDWMCEMVAVPAAGVVRATATTQPAKGYPVDTIAVLEVDLGLPRPGSPTDAPVRLGDLPVDRCGMVLADAVALDSWVGFMHGEQSVDGLADLFYHGRDKEMVHERFGGSDRAGWAHPLLTGTVEVARCETLFIAWDGGDHSMRHRGERSGGQVYPVTIGHGASGNATLRWTIPPAQPDDD